MQKIKPRAELNILAGLPIILSSLLAIIFIPNYILHLSYASWIAVAIIIACLIMPIRKIRLGKLSERSISIGGLFLRIAGLQLSLYVMQNLIVVASYTFFSERSTFVSATPPSEALSQIYHLLLSNSALFPWPIVIVIALGLGNHAFNQQKNAYASTLFQPFINKTPKDAFGIVVNMTWRAATYFAFCSTLMITAFAFSTLISSTLPATAIYGYNNSTALLIFIIFIFLMFKRNKKRIMSIIKKYPKKNAPIFFIFFIGVTLALIGLAFLNQFLGGDSTQSQAPSWVNAKNWQINTQVFSLLWWGALIPISAIYIAIWAKGHRLTTAIFLSLCMPILLPILSNTLPHSITQLATHLIPLCILGFIICGFAIFLFLKPQSIRWFCWVFLPKTNKLNTAHNKPKTIMLMIYLCLISLTIYLYTGLLFSALAIGQLLIAGLLSSIFSLPCILFHLYQQQKASN